MPRHRIAARIALLLLLAGCATQRLSRQDLLDSYRRATRIEPAARGIWKTELRTSYGMQVKLKADSTPFGRVELKYEDELAPQIAYESKEFMYVAALHLSEDRAILFVEITKTSLGKPPSSILLPYDLNARRKLKTVRFLGGRKPR